MSFFPKWMSRGTLGFPGAMDPWDGTTYDPTKPDDEQGKSSAAARHKEQMNWAQRFFWSDDAVSDEAIENDSSISAEAKDKLLSMCTKEYATLEACVHSEGYNACRIKRRRYFVCLIDKQEQYLLEKGQLSWYRRWTLERERRRGDTGLTEMSDTESKLNGGPAAAALSSSASAQSSQTTSRKSASDKARDFGVDPELVDVDKMLRDEYAIYGNKNRK